jgi:Zn-dependent M32 family carboxypeptidase
LDASSKAADLSIKLKEISSSQNPLEAIDKAESNGSIDAETAAKIRKTYQGISNAKEIYNSSVSKTKIK